MYFQRENVNKSKILETLDDILPNRNLGELGCPGDGEGSLVRWHSLVKTPTDPQIHS